MNKKTLLTISKISAWILLVLVIIYFITGFSMTGRFGFKVVNPNTAFTIHSVLAIPLLIIILIHAVVSICLFMRPRRKK